MTWGVAYVLIDAQEVYATVLRSEIFKQALSVQYMQSVQLGKHAS